MVMRSGLSQPCDAFVTGLQHEETSRNPPRVPRQTSRLTRSMAGIGIPIPVGHLGR